MSSPEASRCRRRPEGWRWWRIAFPRRPRVRRSAEAARFLARSASGPLPLPKRGRRLEALRWGFVARGTASRPCRARRRCGTRTPCGGCRLELRSRWCPFRRGGADTVCHCAARCKHRAASPGPPGATSRVWRLDTGSDGDMPDSLRGLLTWCGRSRAASSVRLASHVGCPEVSVGPCCPRSAMWPRPSGM